MEFVKVSRNIWVSLKIKSDQELVCVLDILNCHHGHQCLKKRNNVSNQLSIQNYDYYYFV